MKVGAPRRRLRWTGLALSFLLVATALWWWVWVPNWRPALSPGEVIGIDVSAHQGSVDWDAVAADGIEFAYLKATEGGDFVDDRFAQNWGEAERADIARGAYHFFTLCTPGREQAKNFLSIATREGRALPPALDLELAGNCDERPTRRSVLRELKIFLGQVERHWTAQVVLYLGNDFEDRYDVADELDRPLWLRRFLLEPSHSGWAIWQLHGYAHVEGIEGGVDLDVMRTSRVPSVGR